MKAELRKSFKIQDKKLQLNPLTIGQVKKMSQIMKDLEVTEQTDIAELISQIIDKKLPEFMEIIFPGQNVKGIKWDEVEYETLDEVIESFLSLNPRLTKRLRSLFVNLALLGKTITPS